jgi:phenylalanyl-tRNA synthetase beta chain
LSPYQPIKRDFSFVVDNTVTSHQMISAVQKTHISLLLQNVNIFDVYELDENKKAIGIEVTIQSPKETLDENQIKEISEAIIANVRKNCGASLRGE